jgi:hypothetical protein
LEFTVYPKAPRTASVIERQCGAGGLGIRRVCPELGIRRV